MSMFSVFCPLLCGNQTKNILEHIKECKNKDYLNKYYFQCPYNPIHICSKNVFPIHKENCPDKIDKKEISSSDNLSLNPNVTPIKSNKNIQNYLSASCSKKGKLNGKNFISQFLTEENEINESNLKSINKTKKKNEDLKQSKKEIIFNYNDNISSREKEILLRPTPIKSKKELEINLNHIDISNKEIQLKESSSDKKKEEKNISNSYNNNHLVLIGKLKKQLNFDIDNELNEEKEGSIYSERTDTSSESSLKNMKKNLKKKVTFNQKVKIYIYRKNNDDTDIEPKVSRLNSNNKKNNKENYSYAFTNIHTKFL